MATSPTINKAVKRVSSAIATVKNAKPTRFVNEELNKNAPAKKQSVAEIFLEAGVDIRKGKTKEQTSKFGFYSSDAYIINVKGKLYSTLSEIADMDGGAVGEEDIFISIKSLAKSKDKAVVELYKEALAHKASWVHIELQLLVN